MSPVVEFNDKPAEQEKEPPGVPVIEAVISVPLKHSDDEL
jgi:hypothetical protein